MNALEKLNLESLEERRKKLCLSFAKKCQRIPQARELFKEKNKNTPNELKKH